MNGIVPVPFAWSFRAVREALRLAGTLDRADDARPVRRIWTDSRSIEPGDLFVALEGPNFDGHDFVAHAIELGAVGAVVRRVPDVVPEGFPLFPAPDTLVALGNLARYRRLRLPARVIAITGSSGKTTTKELLRAALAGRLRVHATEANLNNRIGVPLTLLSAPTDAEVVVLEMGTNEPGEIDHLGAIAHPDIAVVTTVSEAHLERLGELDEIFREKLSLLGRMSIAGAVVVGDEPAELADRARDAAPDQPLRVAGISDRADLPWRGRLVEADPEGRWRVATPSGTFFCPVPGVHGVRCALVALAAADLVGVPPEAARVGFPATALPGLRSEFLRYPGGSVLVDCYNANPQSVGAAVAWLMSVASDGPRIAVLASMLELGPRSGELHRRLLEEAITSGVDHVVAVGHFAEAARELGLGGHVVVADDTEAARPIVRSLFVPGAVVLLKGSRGMALERLLPELEEAMGQARASEARSNEMPEGPATGEGRI